MSDKSISDLWAEFSMHQRSALNVETLANVQRAEKGKRAKVLAAKMDDRAKELRGWAENVRATLLEQGDHDKAQDGRHASMTFEGDGIVRVDIAAPVRCNADDLRNLAARANFLAWEMEQRQREAGEK
jgi:hypothetical protein